MTRRQIGAVKECVGSGLWRAQEARYSRGGGGASDGEKRGSGAVGQGHGRGDGEMERRGDGEATGNSRPYPRDLKF